ncbi:MAG TPA: DNA-binding protein [Verrucomicrobia bacterium]|nr:DNA-binding protein [Verrucomicrobiota bacterium]
MVAKKKEQTVLAKATEHSLQDRIFTIRGEKVILDSDLAEIYGVETKRLNEQVRRNTARFPLDFAFRLTKDEAGSIQTSRSQNATMKQGTNIKYLPRVFTEHGALMAANVLNSTRAVEMSVFVVRAFTKMRTALSDTRELARKLATLEREVKSRLDSHDAAIVDVMQRILDLIDPPEHPAPPLPPPQRKIGFSVKESPAKYGTRCRKEKEKINRAGANA